ncbi:hypothetical protein LCGC14_2916170 [marine sediment metagenome]|uniref:HNH domain-containing protein n=1 Tax=marine sediment metagenome TaxID=412755 RepID=A0A0F8YC02_9ZZZZ
MKCLICTVRRTTSTHHIKPRDNGGSNKRRNKIMLCRPCHDIVEEIYNRTGTELSPQVIKLIKLEYGFPMGDIDEKVDMSILATSLYSLRRSYKRKFAKEENIKNEFLAGTTVTCPICGKLHLLGKSGVIKCPTLLKVVTASDRETETFLSMLTEKIKKVRISIE